MQRCASYRYKTFLQCMEGRQRHMSDAGFVYKISVSGGFCESPGPTKFRTRNSTKEHMEMGRTRLQNAIDIHSESNHALDSWWQESAGRPKETWGRSVAKEMKAPWWSWDHVTELTADRKHLGRGHMCNPTRTGLRKT